MDSIISRFINVWLHPWATMAYVKEQGEESSLKSSMIFVLIMGAISGLITAIVGSFLPPANLGAALPKGFVWLAVVLVPLASFIGSFIGAFVLWGLIHGFLNGTMGQYKTSYRLLALLAAFSPVSSLLQPIPVVGQYLAIAVNLWAIIVMIRGIIIVMDTQPVRTWVICGLLFGFLFALGIFARVAAQRGNLGANPDFSELGTGPGGEDLGFETGDLDKELRDLADKAKQESKQEPKK